jgi:hypothetical protein
VRSWVSRFPVRATSRTDAPSRVGAVPTEVLAVRRSGRVRRAVGQPRRRADRFRTDRDRRHRDGLTPPEGTSLRQRDGAPIAATAG